MPKRFAISAILYGPSEDGENTVELEFNATDRADAKRLLREVECFPSVIDMNRLAKYDDIVQGFVDYRTLKEVRYA